MSPGRRYYSFLLRLLPTDFRASRGSELLAAPPAGLRGRPGRPDPGASGESGEPGGGVEIRVERRANPRSRVRAFRGSRPSVRGFMPALVQQRLQELMARLNRESPERVIPVRR